jgi:DNA replication protein DnaC
LQNALSQIVETNTQNYPSDKPYACPHCNIIVPRMEIEFLGIKKSVQPVCKCETDKLEHERMMDATLIKRKQIERLFSISNLGERFENASFKAFKPRLGAEKVFRIARKYVEEFKDWGSDSLLIWGEPGNGKTHIASAVANEVSAKGSIVVFQSVPELLERIRSTFNKNSKESEQEIMKALTTCDLLVLDDIGAEKLTDWVQDVIYRVIDGRYRKKLPTFYTSNLKPGELAEQLGFRTIDRITETSLMLENKATSYRREIARQRMARFAE